MILVICFILFLKAALHKIWSSDLCLAHHFPWVPGTPASRYIGHWKHPGAMHTGVPSIL